MSNYRDTCPQRTITQVHHTVQTWLPVSLSCGHVEKINWTARVGQTIGCCYCQDEVEHGPRANHWKVAERQHDEEQRRLDVHRGVSA